MIEYKWKKSMERCRNEGVAYAALPRAEGWNSVTGADFGD